jgi:hypothetical protein
MKLDIKVGDKITYHGNDGLVVEIKTHKSIYNKNSVYRERITITYIGEDLIPRIIRNSQIDDIEVIL